MGEQDIDELGWFKSLENDESGLWLEVIPKKNNVAMSSDEFMTAMLLRLRLDMPWIADGLRCNCKKKVHLDPKGHHVLCLCANGGTRIHIHDKFVRVLHQMTQTCGYESKCEPRGLFHMEDENNNKRGDILVNSPPYSGCEQLLIDVAQKYPISTTARGITMEQALNPNSLMEKTIKSKNNKYYDSCNSIGIGFLALTFETSGKLHNHVITFVEKISEHYAKVNCIPKGVVARYWLTQLQFTIQKAMAQGIMHRVLQLQQNKIIYHQRHSPEVIADFFTLNAQRQHIIFNSPNTPVSDDMEV